MIFCILQATFSNFKKIVLRQEKTVKFTIILLYENISWMRNILKHRRNQRHYNILEKQRIFDNNIHLTEYVEVLMVEKGNINEQNQKQKLLKLKSSSLKLTFFSV